MIFFTFTNYSNIKEGSGAQLVESLFDVAVGAGQDHQYSLLVLNPHIFDHCQLVSIQHFQIDLSLIGHSRSSLGLLSFLYSSNCSSDSWQFCISHITGFFFFEQVLKLFDIGQIDASNDQRLYILWHFILPPSENHYDMVSVLNFQLLQGLLLSHQLIYVKRKELL